MQSQAQFNDLRFATEYPSLIALPQIIATCTQAGLPSSLVTSLRRLQTCLKNAATTIAFYVAPAQGPVLDQLINGIPVKSFIQELIQSLGEPNKYLTTATVTRSQQQLSITMGGKTFQQDITSVDEVSEALEQIQGFEQSIRRALDRLHTILSKLPPSDSVDTQHAQVETAINVAIAALDIAFDRAPFRINKGVITAAALTLPHNRLNVDLSILNHPSFAILSAGTAIPGFGFYSLNAKGEEWALTQMKHRGPWPVLDELLNCYKPSSDVSIIANEEPWDRLRGSLGRSIASFNSTSRSRFNEVARSKVRIVVCGGLSSGKSTMLNALIGKELLITSERASTAWPILVKHDPTQMEPILEMNPDHFKPFLAALSTISETEFWNKVESLDRKLMPHLSDLRTAGFSFSPQPVLGYDAIRTVLLQINALIRGCYSCSLPVERPRLLNDNWPKITISMEQFRSHPYSIEFIDLPGFNDGIIPKADLMMLLETAFQSSEGGLLVFKAASSTIDSAAFHMYAQHILHSRQGKPLIAVGTGADEHIYNPRLWDREALGAIRSILRIRNGSDDSGGVVVCSPEWFWSANVTIEEVRKLNKVPSLEKLRQTDAEMALDLWWPQGKDLMDYWQTLTPQNIVSIMEEEAKKSQFHLVSQCVEGRLIKDALHQHRTLATEAISNEAMSLCNQYQSLLDMSCLHHLELNQSLETLKGFQSQCSTVSLRMKFERLKLDTDLYTRIQNTLNAHYKEAESKIIREYEESNSLSRIDNESKHILGEAQEKLVIDLREQANEAWRNHFVKLDEMIGREISPGATLTKDLLNSIREDLKKLYEEPMNNTVQKLITAISAKRGIPENPAIASTLLGARATAERVHLGLEDENRNIYSIALERMVKSPRSVLSRTSDKLLNFIRLFNPAEEKTLTADLEDWLDPREAEQLRMAATNLTGCLVRASIFIPIKAMADEQVKDKTEAYALLKEEVVRPWKLAMEKELLQSLSGLSEVSLAVGEKIVVEAVQERIDTIKARLSCKALPLLREDLEYLIMNEANCVAATYAARAIYRQLNP